MMLARFISFIQVRILNCVLMPALFHLLKLLTQATSTLDMSIACVILDSCGLKQELSYFHFLTELGEVSSESGVAWALCGVHRKY